MNKEIIHRCITNKGIHTYACANNVGNLSKDQLNHKTNFKGKKITCKNCKRMIKHKGGKQHERTTNKHN